MPGSRSGPFDGLADFEAILLSIFDDRSQEQSVMAATELRLRQEMAKTHRTRFRHSSLLGTVAVAAAGIMVALVSSSLHGAFHRRPQTTSPAQITKSSKPPQLNAIDDACLLPVWLSGAAKAGFIQLPAGSLTLDASTSAADIPADVQIATYDQVLQRWLPVSSDSPSLDYRVAPDGRSYAYLTVPAKGAPGGRTLKVVDLVGGQRNRAIWTTSSNVKLIAFTDLGVALQSGRDVLLVDPRDGSSRHLTVQGGDLGRYSWFDGGGASLWGTDFGGVSPVLVRLDLKDLTIEIWLDSAGLPKPMSVLGLDENGHPVLMFGGLARETPFSVVDLRAARHPDTIYAGRVGDGVGFDPTNAIGDRRGIWFGSKDGATVWLFKDGSLRKASVKLPKEPTLDLYQRTGALDLTIAGTCQ